MRELGYPTYVAQGGDIGSFLSCQLGQTYPEKCRAVLVNMLVASPPTFNKSPVAWLKWVTAPQLFYTAAELEHLGRTAWFFNGEAGYQVIPSFPVICQFHGLTLSDRQYREPSLNHFPMAFGTRLSPSWHGLEKSWRHGVILILGQRAKLLLGS